MMAAVLPVLHGERQHSTVYWPKILMDAFQPRWLLRCLAMLPMLYHLEILHLSIT